MLRYMYFGTKRKMRWVKIDAPGRSQEMSGFSDRLDYSNGGVSLRESTNAHQEFTLSWNSMTREQARAVTDYAYGIYGSGEIYFVDPVSADQNVLNVAWSAPAITAKDGVPLAGKIRPTLVQNSNLQYDYPAEMARYNLTEDDTSRSFYVPIPPGFTAVVGVHGDEASTLGVKVQPMQAGISSGAASIIYPIGTNTRQRFTNGFPSTEEQSGIQISLEIGNGYISLAGLMVQVLPTAVTPESVTYGEGGYGEDGFGGIDSDYGSGPFILGQGASGCRFEGKPTVTPYSIYHDRVGLSAKLVEVEDWL